MIYSESFTTIVKFILYIAVWESIKKNAVRQTAFRKGEKPRLEFHLILPTPLLKMSFKFLFVQYEPRRNGTMISIDASLKKKKDDGKRKREEKNYEATEEGYRGCFCIGRKQHKCGPVAEPNISWTTPGPSKWGHQVP